MKKLIVLLLAFCILLTGVGFAKDKRINKKLSVEEIHQKDALNNLLYKLDDLEKLALNITEEKHSDCIKAFGDEHFCQCLGETLPVAATFPIYISVVITPKEELGYSSLSTKDKKLVDLTLAAREKCVSGK